MNYKKKANITLALVATGFVVSSVLLFLFKGNTFVRMLFFVVEAALIGGMADWFAVTAIFKKPLGFPFHTAIIPKNRATLVNSIVNIVEKEFLSADIIGNRLEKIEITPKLIKWMDSDSGREYMKITIVKVLKNLEDEHYEKINEFISEQIVLNTKNIDFNKYIHNFAEDSIRNGSYKKLLSLVLDDIIKVAEGPEVRNKILAAIENVKAEKTKGFLGALFDVALEETNLVNITEIADSIHMHLIETLYNLRKQDNEDAKFLLGAIEEHLLLNGSINVGPEVVDLLKEQVVGGVIHAGLIREMVEELVDELENDKVRITGAQSDNIASMLAADVVTDIGIDADAASINIVEEPKVTVVANEAAMTATATTTTREEVSLFGVLLKQVEKTWNNMKNDVEFIDYIEKNLKESIHILIQREHGVIGKIARDTLDSFSDDALNKFIEDRAGNDLQWIRINGSIVGGMVGLLVFLFLTYFYEPIAVPFIRGLFL